MAQVLEIVGQLMQLAGAGVGLYTAVMLARRARARRRPVQQPPRPDAEEGPQDETA
ncbi:MULTISPECIES: hypothetical protein [unclassified Nonomuraea]|uniref:hypothetical protein n=1 Tax=unclassified Nonomuraea TaxID=2593643 RepID=UPI0033DC11A1